MPRPLISALIPAIIAAIGTVRAQVPPQSPAIAALERAIGTDADAESRFWQTIRERGAPLVEPAPDDPQSRLLTFVLRAPAHTRRPQVVSNLNAVQVRELVNDFFGDTLLGRFTRVPGSSTWYATYTVSRRLRVPYQFRVEEEESDAPALGFVRAQGSTDYLDPANSVVYGRGTDAETSVATMDAAPPQPWRSRTDAPRFDTVSLSGSGGSRAILVHRPPADAPRDGYPVVLAIAPFTFVDRIPTSWIIDYLVDDGEIRAPILAIVPEPPAADANARYIAATAFLVDTVLPLLRSRYPITSNPQDVIVTGTSRRGLIGAVAAVDRPDRIGAVLSLSASYFWRPPDGSRHEWLAERLANEPGKPIRWFVASGNLEYVVTPGNRGHYMLATNRHIRDVLTARGYELTYVEFDGVHHELNWEDALASGLRALLALR